MYGAAVGVLAGRKAISAGTVKAVITLNFAWALGSVIAVVTGSAGFTTLGAVWAVLQAIVVGIFAELQIMGLRKAR